MTRAAIYARISLDRKDGAGVTRQLEDCRTLADTRGWQTAEYVDNDVSAFAARRRPEWTRLLDDLRAGTVDAVIAYHPDRLYRRLTDLEDLAEVIERTGAQVITAKAGDVDLTTASGRLSARFLAAVSRHESERIGERVSRAKQQAAAEGRPGGGGYRPFGLTADRTAQVPEEAAWIQQMAEAVAAGATWYSQARALNDAGVTTTAGNPWTAGKVRKLLTSPHVAGLRTYRGQIVADTIAPAILDRDLWELVARTRPARKVGRPAGDRYLLTGLLACSACQKPMYGSTARSRGYRAYLCQSHGQGGHGCGRSIAADPAEAHVLAVVEGWLADPDGAAIAAQAPVRAVPAPGADDVAELERRRNLVAARWGAGEIDDQEYEAARAPLIEAIDRARAALGEPPAPRVDARMLALLQTGWPAMTTAERRSAIGDLCVTPIPVGPGVRGQRNPEAIAARLTIVARWEQQ